MSRKAIPSNKKAYIKGLKKLGFEVEKSKHYKVTHPQFPGILVVVSTTEGDKNAIRQSIREMRRKFPEVTLPWM